MTESPGATRIVLPHSIDPVAGLRTYLWSRWSSDLRIGNVTQVNSYTRRVSINARRVDLVFDLKRRKRIFSFHTIENLAEFSVKSAPKKWIIEGPTLWDFLSCQEGRKLGVISQSERVLLKVGCDKLIDMRIVKNALTPIENLLMWLATEGSISLEDWRRTGKSQGQLDNYLYILGKLDLVKVEKSRLVPGGLFRSDFAERPPKEIFAGMLARAVQEEYPFLHQVLRLTQVVGPLHWANSYYLTALLAERQMITMPFWQVEQRFIGYYPGRGTTPMQRRGQLMRVMDASRILTGDKNAVSGDPTVTDRYFSEASNAGWQPAV